MPEVRARTSTKGQAVAEKDIDVSGKTKTQLTPEMADWSDMTVAIFEEHERHFVPDYLRNSPKLAYWSVKDGKGQPYEYHCQMRDDILRRVKELENKLNIEK